MKVLIYREKNHCTEIIVFVSFVRYCLMLAGLVVVLDKSVYYIVWV